MNDSIHPFFVDLQRSFEAQLLDLAKTVEGLPPEALDWVPGTDMNSLAVLLVHSAKSTRYLVGDVVLGELSNRDRAAEFATTGVSAAQLIALVQDCVAYVRGAIPRITFDDLTQERPMPGRDRSLRASWALLHALDHLASHVGHAQVTRQLWDQRAG
jgi:hypothetical protein